MSVSIGLGFSKQKNQIHPYQQLFRNILERLDSIQGHQAKPYLKTSLIDPNGYKEFEKIEQKMKIIISSNVQNLRMVEENMKQNIEQLYQKVRHFENKIIRTLKEKQEVLQYLQYRVGSVESSQKNVTQFMKKVSENQSEKYSGVPILEERMRQMQHLFELKNLKTTDHMKIWHEQMSMEINKNMKLLNQKIDRNKQQSNENRLNWKQKNQISQNPKQQIRQLKRKIQIVQIQMREQILKCAQLQSSLKEFTENTQRTLNKISKQQRQIKQYEQSLKNKQAAVKPKFNTQGHESDLNLEQKKNNIFSKKTETEQKSSLFPTKTTKNQINNPRHFLGATTSRGEQSNPDSEKKNKVYHLDESDQDPFQNMVGGIRGLLKKSKEKQVKYDSKKKLNENIEKKKPLPRQQKLGELIHESPKNYLMNKNLPPVKGDLRKNNRPSYINSEQNQEQEQVYQVDQDGFLLDEQGNYLYDQDGNRVQIEEQMYDLIEDRR